MLFSDETTINFVGLHGVCERKPPHAGGKIMLWGCFCTDTYTYFSGVDGKMDGAENRANLLKYVARLQIFSIQSNKALAILQKGMGRKI